LPQVTFVFGKDTARGWWHAQTYMLSCWCVGAILIPKSQAGFEYVAKQTYLSQRRKAQAALPSVPGYGAGALSDLQRDGWSDQKPRCLWQADQQPLWWVFRGEIKPLHCLRRRRLRL